MHEITDTDNLFSVREMPWHGIGEVLDEYPTRKQAQAIAHPWEPVTTAIYRKVPHITADGDLVETYEEITTHVGQERSDNGFLLGVTAETYTPVKNDEMYDLAEALESSAPGEVKYETGGTLRGGTVAWLMLRLREPIQIKGDPNGAVLPYYLLSNAFDGSASFKGSATGIRVVCANTLRAADFDSHARGSEFIFRHTASVTEKVEAARHALAGWKESMDEFRQLADLMVTEKVSAKGEIEFIERFIPAPVSTLTSDRVKANIEAARNQWWDVYRSATCEGITGTAWGLVQASSEWSEHIRKAKNDESRFRRSLLETNRVISTARDFAREAAHV
jgi:phage/plasmid-like protein (TIGR03299 family)